MSSNETQEMKEKIEEVLGWFDSDWENWIYGNEFQCLILDDDPEMSVWPEDCDLAGR